MSASELQRLQVSFQEYVLGNTSGKPVIATSIRAGFGLDVSERLSIYFNAYRSRMCEALSEVYVKTWAYVGDDIFADLAASYLQDHPSNYRNLRWFGDCFAAHVEKNLPDCPFVVELAAFEWALGLTFDAVDAEVATFDCLRKLPPEDWGGLVLDWHPSVQLLSMKWNSIRIWQALDKNQAPPDVEEIKETWLLWRTNSQPNFRSLDVIEADALRRLGQGASFADVCETIADTVQGIEITQQLAGYLQNWLCQGVLMLQPPAECMAPPTNTEHDAR